MSETMLQWLVLARVFLVAAFSFLYSLGGLGIKGGKLWRRYIASSVLVGGVLAISIRCSTFHWWFLLGWPMYVLSLSQGYGVNDDNSDASNLLWRKVQRRTWYGLCLGGCSLVFVHSLPTLALAGFQIVLSMVSSVLLGVSGWLDARSEESCISLASALFVPFMV